MVGESKLQCQLSVAIALLPTWEPSCVSHNCTLHSAEDSWWGWTWPSFPGCQNVSWHWLTWCWAGGRSSKSGTRPLVNDRTQCLCGKGNTTKTFFLPKSLSRLIKKILWSNCKQQQTYNHLIHFKSLNCTFIPRSDSHEEKLIRKVLDLLKLSALGELHSKFLPLKC